MLITLKEAEIEVAVKRYLAAQGINLSGKAVSVEFTATRSNGGGIRADVAIDEVSSEIPGFTDKDEDVDTKPALAAVPTPAAAPAVAAVAAVAAPTDAKASAPKSVKEIAAAAAAVVLPEDTAAAGEAADAPVKPAVSLFS